MTKDEEIVRLMIRVAALEKDNQLLREELSFLKTFPTLAQGLKGEALVAQLTRGTVTGYAVRHDVEVDSGDRLEVKYSHVNVQSATKTRRWNWYNLLGRQDKGKEYDYLVLVGESEMFVMIRWEHGGLAVPLSQLSPSHASKATTVAIGDWHYWVEQGYRF